MAIRVRFDKNGFYHPSFGRLGRGKDAGTVYRLPDMFAETETYKVAIMDPTSKPPKKVGEKEITRYKHLPRTAEILDDEAWEGIVEEAAQLNEPEPKAITPTISELTDKDPEEAAGAAKKPKAMDAVERTTGTKRPARRRAVRA